MHLRALPLPCVDSKREAALTTARTTTVDPFGSPAARFLQDPGRFLAELAHHIWQPLAPALAWLVPLALRSRSSGVLALARSHAPRTHRAPHHHSFAFPLYA